LSIRSRREYQDSWTVTCLYSSAAKVKHEIASNMESLRDTKCYCIIVANQVDYELTMMNGGKWESSVDCLDIRVKWWLVTKAKGKSNMGGEQTMISRECLVARHLNHLLTSPTASSFPPGLNDTQVTSLVRLFALPRPADSVEELPIAKPPGACP
jgi:hypothetical protein